LEVASVGRSLGNIVGQFLSQRFQKPEEKTLRQFYETDLSSVIASACLAHDIGNPAFGHSGERAISNYFLSREHEKIEGMELRKYFSDTEWIDLVNFEGNANALRVLTHGYHNKPAGGMRLTFTTIASLIKYPCEASAMDKAHLHQKKYGFFQTEKETFKEITEELNMHEVSTDPLIYKRHPFVFLVEAADDICYRIIDMEDAHRLGIIGKELVKDAFIAIIEQLGREEDDPGRILDIYSKIRDDNDSISYLRAKVINALTLEASDVFTTQNQQILRGAFDDSLIGYIESSCSALKEVIDLSVKKIYNHHSVVEIEITGFHVMSKLLELFVPAVLRNRKIGTDEKALQLIPEQFREYEVHEDPYRKVLSVVDFISGMTDTYATEFYRKTAGIDISKHS
jgi:dGTPase